MLKIFDPYFSTKIYGSGLGLAKSYSIVRNHGGTIEVASIKGKGSTFSIYLPVSEDAPKKEEVKNQSVISGTGDLLIMDDDNSVRQVMEKVLTNIGYRVDMAIKGEDALAMYKNHTYNAVILDLTVPGGMGGKETLQKLKEIDPEVKAVLCSGYSNNDAISRYKQLGFKAALRKSFRIEELSMIIRKVIEGEA